MLRGDLVSPSRVSVMALVDDPGVHRFTVDEFLGLAETMDGKVELIDG
jgi:hypothetical protein